MNPIPISAFSDNYIWTLVDEPKGLFYCVDPGEAEPVQAFAQSAKLRLETILLTHHHYDHIGGVSQLLHLYPESKVYGPRDGRIPTLTDPVQAQDLIKIGDYAFQILSNPGHTATHISYYEPQRGWLFCGDTLFSAGCGRVFDGTMDELYQSIQLFRNLPPKTLVFCAHEYTLNNLLFAQSVEPDNADIKAARQRLKHQTEVCSLPSTIELEAKINPFFRTKEEGVTRYALLHGARSTSERDVFETLRRQKDQFKASSIEL